MICIVCREGMASIWEPENPRRLGHVKEFPEVLHQQYPRIREDDDVDEVFARKGYWEPEKYVYGHHRDYDSLARARAQGCVVCRQFNNANDEDDVNTTFAAAGYYSVFAVELSCSTRPEMTIYMGEDTDCFSFELVEHDSEDFLNSAITSSTADAETWALVQGWLDACTEGHRSCRGHGAKGFAPTRLLELDGAGWEQTFRLVDSAQLGPSAEPYVTLSHCWGAGPAEEKLRFIHATERQLRDGMPASRLPRLFRDALEIADRLAVRYIWIDRLCIIQDSAEDWAAEAATMQTVYQNGFLNIAALGAKDDRYGCFFDRDPLLEEGEGRQSGWRSTFENEPLLSRAWVVQERVLAARTLYFGSKQVFWECYEATRCETDPARNLNQPLKSRIPRAPRHPDGKLVPQPSWKVIIDPNGSSVGDWQTIVHSYCQCNLTFAADKLVALSGLARDMEVMLKEGAEKGHRNVYLAGLWRDDMPACLLWVMKRPQQRLPTYRAPSWSWAALDGVMSFQFDRRQDPTFFPIDILGAQTVLRGEEAMGEVVGGSIIFSGPILVLGKATAVKYYPPDREHHLFRALHHPDTGKSLDIRCGVARVEFDTYDDCHSEVTMLVLCGYTNEQWGSLVAQGLALVPVDGVPFRYRRVGYTTINVSTADEEVINFDRDLLEKVPTRIIEIV